MVIDSPLLFPANGTIDVIAGAVDASEVSTATIFSINAGCRISSSTNFMSFAQMMTTLGRKELENVYFLDRDLD